MKSFEQKAAKTAKAAAAEYAAVAGFVLIRNPGIFAGGVDRSLLRGLRELLFKNSFAPNPYHNSIDSSRKGLSSVAALGSRSARRRAGAGAALPVTRPGPASGRRGLQVLRSPVADLIIP
jgi:hypothetical protein